MKVIIENSECLSTLNEDTWLDSIVELLFCIEIFSISTPNWNRLLYWGLWHFFSISVIMEISKEKPECFEIWSENNFWGDYVDFCLKWNIFWFDGRCAMLWSFFEIWYDIYLSVIYTDAFVYLFINIMWFL